MKNLYKNLSQPFPEEAIERTKGSVTKKGYDTTGIKYQYVVNRFNEVLGIGSFRVDRQYNINEKTSRNGRTMYECCCDLTLFLGKWSEGEFIPFAEAVSTGGHISTNIADAKKGAFTNGFKKAAAFLGCGWQAYAGVIDDDNIPWTEPQSSPTPQVPWSNNNKQPKQKKQPAKGRITHAQLGKLRQLVDQLGGEWKDFKTYVNQRFNKQLQYLNKREASDIIGELIDKERRVG
ncbi:MAG: Rad52/Rad22 family DNA repair protein [Deltaproteobacteria bacterium]|jgi:hypothetical protein|nr:Rad52/Rad22 family DNA repair protein [Deltaproteobacteria bacterium]